MSMEIGILTFGEVTRDPDTGRTPSPRQRLLDTLEQARLADEVGLDVFGVGEHHRGDFIASATPVILSAIASVTKHIRLASTVTVLSSDDPVRVWEQYATIDRIMLQMGLGGMPQKDQLKAIELLGTDVAPEIRRLTKDDRPSTTPTPSATADAVHRA